MASWMCQRRTVWQKWLKYSEISDDCINDILYQINQIKHRMAGEVEECEIRKYRNQEKRRQCVMAIQVDFQLFCKSCRQYKVFSPLNHELWCLFPNFVILIIDLLFPSSISSILNITMKAKPIINESNFPKVPSKQALFIVRPKPSQQRLQLAPATRQTRLPTSLQPNQKSIDECLACLDLQLSEEQTMPRGACLRIKQHLLALRLKYIPEQQSYNQNRNTLESPQLMIRKQSSKFFKSQKCDTIDDFRNKENISSTQSFLTQKITRGKSNNEDHQIQIHALQHKLKQLSDRMEEYEKGQHTLGLKIRLLENDLEHEIKEKTEIKNVFQEEIKKKEASESILLQSLESLEQKISLMQKQHRAAVQRLSQRESEIVTLWQLLSK